MITTILWDVDGTLLDFLAAEKAAIRTLFAEFGFGECTDEAIARYSKINRRYWEKLENGELTKPEVLVGRFREFFETEGLDVTAAPAFNERYRNSAGTDEKAPPFRAGGADGRDFSVRRARCGKAECSIF